MVHAAGAMPDTYINHFVNEGITQYAAEAIGRETGADVHVSYSDNTRYVRDNIIPYMGMDDREFISSYLSASDKPEFVASTIWGKYGDKFGDKSEWGNDPYRGFKESILNSYGQNIYIDYIKETGTSVKGGEGSGNFGHEGRPGEVGGSGPGGGLTIRDDVTGHSSGQTNGTLAAYTESGELAAHLDYAIYQGVPSIQYVESTGATRGAGKELVRELAKEYGYENIEWGMMTEDGMSLRDKLDNEYGVERVIESYDPRNIVDSFGGEFIAGGTREFYGGFSPDKTTEVTEHLEKIGAEHIDVQDAGDMVYISAELPEDKIVVRKKD
jgi:hypothetical protein